MTAAILVESGASLSLGVFECIRTLSVQNAALSAEISVRCAALLSRRVISESSGYGKWQQRARLGIGSAVAVIPYCPTPELLPASDGAAAEERRGLFCILPQLGSPFSLTHSSRGFGGASISHALTPRFYSHPVPCCVFLPVPLRQASRQLRISNTSVVVLVGMVCEFFHPRPLRD